MPNHSKNLDHSLKKQSVYPTQLSVAREVGLSRTTVTEILAGKRLERYSKETQEKVFKAADKLGYRPNHQARLLRGEKSNCIGILSFDVMRSLAQRKIKAATKAILGHGYEWLVQETLWYHSLGSETMLQAVNSLIDARVEGVLLVYPNSLFTQEMLGLFLKANIPVVAIAGDCLRRIPNFISDRQWGYECVTHHLLQGGYRRIILLGSGSLSSHTGFYCAMKAFPDAKYKVIMPIIDIPLYESLPPEKKRYLPGVWGMQEILRQKELPEAVVCMNDDWALGVLTICSQAGVRVPQDLAITGFDNDPSGCYGAVPLTTMEHPIQEISQRAVDCLVELIRENRKPEERMVLIRGKLLVRDSCGLGFRRERYEKK